MTVVHTTYSLSEIEAHAKKAVRGAGFGWGYAEEAAKSVRFLAAHQLPGAVALAAYLRAREIEDDFCGPVMGEGVWSVAEGAETLCPLLSGACLCDAAQLLSHDGESLVLEKLAYPLLVVPYLALMGRRNGQALRISWDGFELVCEEGRVQLPDDMDPMFGFNVTETERFECRVVESVGGGAEAGLLGQVIYDEVWHKLDGYAQCTYVPATEESRRGAGPAD